MKDLRLLNYFLGIVVARHVGGLFLSQNKYVEEIVRRAGMSSCKPCPTLQVDTKPKLSIRNSATYKDPTLYRSLYGALQYLTFTRPDISYAVHQKYLFMHNPMFDHMHALCSLTNLISILLILTFSLFVHSLI
jgi:hypothetical protein